MIACAFLIGSASVSGAAQARLSADWISSHNEWVLRIQPAGSRGSSPTINPTSPALRDKRFIRLVDSATGAAIDFEVKISASGPRLQFFEIVPQPNETKNVTVTVNGLILEDAFGRRVAYNNTAMAKGKSNAVDYSYSAEPQGTPTANKRRSGRRTAPEQTPPPNFLVPPPPSGGSGAPAPMPLAGGSSEPASAKIPQFPFPPPKASAFEVIKRDLLVAGRRRVRLSDVQTTLESAFTRCGYGEKSYYAVPDGFAMASRLEHINEDGTPNADRWSLEVDPMEKFSLRDYLRALFRARPGHYRVIVFIVTTHPFTQTNVQVSSDEASAWASGGLDVLPEEIGAHEFSAGYKCTALIYEFRHAGDQPQFVRPSEVTGKTHLEKAGILAALEQTR